MLKFVYFFYFFVFSNSTFSCKHVYQILHSLIVIYGAFLALESTFLLHGFIKLNRDCLTPFIICRLYIKSNDNWKDLRTTGVISNVDKKPDVMQLVVLRYILSHYTKSAVVW